MIFKLWGKTALAEVPARDNGKHPAEAALRDLIGADLEALEGTLRKYLQGEGSLLRDTTEHVLKNSGKRIRPALVLLCGRASGYTGRRLLPMAAAMELIHTATLVHDDVIDEAETRRGLPSVNSRWGNETSVILGDYIYSAALLHITTDGLGRRTLPIIARTVLRLCSGEMREIETAGNAALTEDEYFAIVRDKTAALMETCCKLGTMYSTASLGLKRRLIRFGEAYGVGFQILDDLLDIYATEEETLKSVGTDVKQGRMTLPMILALKNAGPRRGELERLIASKDAAAVKPLLRDLGAGEAARERLDFWLRRAEALLEVFGDDPAARVLAGLAGDLRVQADALTSRGA